MDHEQKELGEMLERLHTLTKRLAGIWAPQLGVIDEREVIAAAQILEGVIRRRAAVHCSFRLCSVCSESQRINKCLIQTWPCDYCYVRCCEHFAICAEQHVLCDQCYKKAA